MDGATVTEWAVNFKQRFCNALAIKHKCTDSLPINEAQNYVKKNQQKWKVHTNTLRKSLSSMFLPEIFLPYWLKYRRWFG